MILLLHFLSLAFLEYSPSVSVHSNISYIHFQLILQGHLLTVAPSSTYFVPNLPVCHNHKSVRIWKVRPVRVLGCHRRSQPVMTAVAGCLIFQEPRRPATAVRSWSGRDLRLPPVTATGPWNTTLRLPTILRTRTSEFQP